MLASSLSMVGVIAVAGYVYVGVRVGLSSYKRTKSVPRAAWDALKWPDTIIARALDKL